MAIQFDPVDRRIILDSTSITSGQIWEAWTAWAIIGDNLKYLPALSQVGGDSLGSGLSIPLYFFLENNWRVRPMELDHNLTITGNLFVRGGGVPVVATLGAHNVIVNYTVPVQAQAVATGGASVDVNAIATAVRASLATELARIDANITSRLSSAQPDVNVKSINGSQIKGTGQPGDEWGPL